MASSVKTLILLAVCFLLTFNANGQGADAVVSGAVTDPAGAAVAGALVTARNQTTGRSFETQADASGRYQFLLPPGSYSIAASGASFQLMTKEIRLTSGESATVDFQLTLNPVSATVTVAEEVRAELERVPGATAVIPVTDILQSPAVNLRDALRFVPGVVAQPRFGFEQSRISVRGSGLRSNFHLRGINIFINDQPYQDADGFTDLEAIELTALQRVEVWKGANALRFGGNTMGGAINFITETGETASPLALRFDAGSFGFLRGHASTGGVRGAFNYYVSFTNVEFDGYRDHSQQGRQRLYSNFGWRLTDSTDLRFDIIYANAAEKLPGALTRAEFTANPRQADANNVTNDWGRFTDTFRWGTRLTHRFDARQDISFLAYYNYRNLDHPIFQTIDQDARNAGGEVRYRFNGELGGRRNRFVAGFAPQVGFLGERRFVNTFGNRGARTALFDTAAKNFGLYFEDQIDLTGRFTLVAGGRADWATRRFTDLFLSDGDRSDERTFSAFSPKLGFVFRPTEETQIFANFSRSYEAPLLLELTSFGAPGFIALEPQDTWQFEVGTRGQFAERIDWDVAFFNAEIDNEILNINVRPFPFAPFTVPSYRNAANTRHLGLELATNATLARGLFGDDDGLSWRTAYTLSRFRYVDDVAYADNFIPGAPRHLVRSELRYDTARGFWIAPNVDWSAATYFLDSPNTVRNDKYTILNVRAGFDWRRFNFIIEGANLTDRRYAPSTQVDSATTRYFEPGNGRSAFFGLRWRY